MNVFLIMGLTHSGKTTYVMSHKGEQDAFIDFLAVQSFLGFGKNDGSNIFKTNYIAASAAAEVVKLREHENVFIEFPGVRQEDRIIFLMKLKPLLQAGDKIIAVWLIVNREVLKQRLENDAEDIDVESYIAAMEHFCQVPSIDEGYDDIKFVESAGSLPPDQQAIDLAAKHCQYKGFDPIEAKELLILWSKGLCDDALYEHAGSYTINKQREIKNVRLQHDSMLE